MTNGEGEFFFISIVDSNFIIDRKQMFYMAEQGVITKFMFSF